MSMEFVVREAGDSITSGEGAGCLGDGLGSREGSVQNGYGKVVALCDDKSNLYQDVGASFSLVNSESDMSPSRDYEEVETQHCAEW